MMHLLEASKPPEGAGVGVAWSGATGGVGDGREPRASKPDSRRSFCTEAGAGAKGAKAAAVVGARVGDIRPGQHNKTGEKDACSVVS